MAEPYYPKLSLQAASVVTPAASSATLASLLAALTPAVTFSPILRRIIISASAAGIYLNYGAAATSANYPVPTTPATIDILPTDAAKLYVIGDASKTLNVFQISTVTGQP